MWWDRRKLSPYHRVVRIIAGTLVISSAYGITLIVPIRSSDTDPVIKWTVLGVLLLMLILSTLMFLSPSRDR
jgi:hypothetical protein